MLSSNSVQAQSQTPIQVTTKPLKSVLIERKLTANAQVMALNDTTLSAEITAVATAVHAEAGDLVEEGDLLVALDPVDYELQLAQAEANLQSSNAKLQQAKLRLDRANELKQNQYISADDLLARETELSVQKADYQRFLVAKKIAQRQLAKTQIKAPFTGVISMRTVQLGQLLSPGSPVLNLTQTNEREIHAMIPSQLVDTLGQAAQLFFTTKDFSTPVELIQLSPVINQQSSIQNARLKITGEIPAIGTTGQLIWHLKDAMIAADMVVKRNGQLGVFTAVGQQAKFQPLPNAQPGRPVPVEVSADWQVVVGGRERLQDGDVIAIKQN